jgi:tetratricopeptide (TPR) repeat protein
MRLFQSSLLLILIASVGCSQFQKKVSEFSSKKITNPKVDLGISGNDASEMVESALAAGSQASEFLASDLFIKANDASIRGDYQTAATILKHVIKLAPQDIFLKRKLSIELIRIGELKEAEAILEGVFAETKFKDESVGLILAGVYAALDKPEKARVTYQKIINTSNDVEEACLFLAKSYATEKKYFEAHALLGKCEKKSKEPVFSFYRGKIEFERGNKLVAKKFFEKALHMDASYAQAALALGVYYEEKEDLNSAIKTYKKFLEGDGNSMNVPVLSRLVTVLFSLEKNEEIIPYAEVLSSLDGNDLNLKVRLGLLYSEAGRYDEATNLFKEVLAVVPESDKVIYYLGALSQQTNKYDEAIDYFKRINANSPLFGDAGVQIGQMLAAKAKEEFVEGRPAGEYFSRFMKFAQSRIKEHEDSLVEIKLLQASYYEDTAQFKDAIGVLTEIKSHKNFTESHSYYLASILEKDGQYLEARKMVQSILEKDPNNAHALNFLGYSYLEKNEKMDLAFEYISKAVKLRPDDGYIRDSLAWYYFQMGKMAEALIEAKKAFELVKTDAIITKHLGMIYQRMNNQAKAKEYLTEALKQTKAPTEREDLLKQLNELENPRLPASESK